MASSYIDKGTLITLGDGSRIAIEDLKVGDEVQSYNMQSEQFDMSHIENNEQISAKITDIIPASIAGDKITKLSLSNDTTLTVSRCNLFSPDMVKGYLTLEERTEMLEGDIADKHVVSTNPQIEEEDLVFIDSGQELGWLTVVSIGGWKSPREMYNLWVESGDSIFANEVLVSVDRQWTEEEEEEREAIRLENEKEEPPRDTPESITAAAE
tara:strand:- start:255 stop:887 length:633 start_codon:yes stop_codon:yes gene_type:complete